MVYTKNITIRIIAQKHHDFNSTDNFKLKITPTQSHNPFDPIPKKNSQTN